MGIILAVIITFPVAYLIGWVIGVKHGVRFIKEQWVEGEVKAMQKDIDNQITINQQL